MKTATELQKEIQKTRNYLRKLEMQLRRVGYRPVKRETEEQRIKRLEAEFKKKYPNLEVDTSILKLVGTEPYNPPSKDKEVTRRIIAERYG